MPDTERLELEEVLEQLGGAKEEFRPHPGNVVAARVIGPFTMIAGATIVFFVLNRADLPQQKFYLVLGFGGLLMIGGLGPLFWSFRRSSYRFLVCKDGLAEVQSGKNRVCRWDDITKVDEIERMLPQYRLTSQRKTWTIFYRQNEKLHFDLQSVREIDRLVELVRTEANQRNIPWNKKSQLMG
jgi:hypothetical protein